MDYAKAYAVATGGHRAGVLESSFIAEVKSDLMGEQTILCGVLQTASILSFNKMVELVFHHLMLLNLFNLDGKPLQKL